MMNLDNVRIGAKIHHTNHGIGTVAKILGKQNSAVHLSSAQYYLEVDFPNGVENVWSDAVTDIPTPYTYTLHSGMGDNPTFTDREVVIREWAQRRGYTWASVKRNDGVWVATSDGMVWA